MFASPTPRGRILALDFLVFAEADLPTHTMIVATTTRFDDGHVTAWHIESDGSGLCWPASLSMNPSILHSPTSEDHLNAMGVKHRQPVCIGSVPICLDELENVCRRSPLPDMELGEDHSAWCLDVLFKLERMQAIAPGQTLALERCMGFHNSSPGSEAAIASSNASDYVTFQKPTEQFSDASLLAC